MTYPVNRFLHKLLPALFVVLSTLNLSAQLSVSQQNAQGLVQNVLVGSGVTVSNISFTGDPRMLGSFDGSNSNIGLKNGIIMSTGRIYDAVGPNNAPSTGEDLNRPGYIPLQNLLGADAKTQDAAILKFNFFCEGDKVQFKYVFASEEYPEYVGSKYNDVFAFFISGPGISGTQNIAKIPGSNDIPVAINNVNQNSFSNYFVNNGNGITGGGSTVQFDGFTKPFVAEATVIPCQEYTIIMAIADVSDGLYDSGVFLEAQSFSSPEVNIRQRMSYMGSNTVLYENCGFNRITLTRTGETIKPMTVYLESGGTATYGVDYTAFPKKVTFEPGKDTVSFIIEAFADNQNEPNGETVSVIYRDTGCTEIKVKRVDFSIFDPPGPLQVTAGDNVNLVCPREPVDLNAKISGGVPPYIIQWNEYNTGNPFIVEPDSSGKYRVKVTDQCGTVVNDSLYITIVNYTPMKFNIPLEYSSCAGETVKIGGLAIGGKQPLKYFWSHDASDSPFITVTPGKRTIYTLTVTDSCNISITRMITVNVINVNALFDVEYVNEKTIQFKDYSNPNIVKWNWDFGDLSDHADIQHPLHAYADTGKYLITLIVTDTNNCMDTVSNPIRAYPPFNFYIPDAFTPDGDGINDMFSGVGEGFVTYEMFIFNRWGELIFHTKSYNDKWGAGKRDVLDRIPIDTYVYKFILTTPMLERKQYIGRVTVIR